MASTVSVAETFRLNGFVVDPQRNLISLDGQETGVEPRVMEVLCFLAAHAEEVVSRATIINAVWGVAHGGDESLTRAISLLRKALALPTDCPEIIQTVPKRGYRLNANPQPGPPLPSAVPILSAARLRPRRMWLALVLSLVGLAAACAFLILSQRTNPTSRISGIVVLVEPFGSEPPSPSADTVTDSVAASLSRFDQIKVRRVQPGMTVNTQGAYHFLLSGRLESQGDSRRLAVQLQNYASKDIVWSQDEVFSGKAISALSAELKLALLQAAKTEVEKKPVTSLSPWELVLLGTWVPGADREWQGPPTTDSYWIWERAIEKDPDFALAHASLAQVMANFALFDPPSDTQAHAERAAKSADRARVLAPYDAGVLFQIALYYRYAGNRDDAAATLRRVIDIEPDNIMARIELEYVTGQCSTQSAEALERLAALEASLPAASPAHWVIASHMADMSLARGDYAGARFHARRSRQIVRQVWSSITLAAADAELGKSSEAKQIVSEHKEQWPALDYTGFANRPLSRWCMGGDTAHARGAFLKLGRAVASEQPG